jgi:5'-nucleotidase
MRALVTNDDGIHGRGLAALARAAVESGLDVTVAAPSWDSSGASASLTAVERDGRFLLSTEVLDGLDDVKAYGVEAAPAFIVRAAVRGAFGDEPDLVLSGINHGPNTGHAVLHSGTVGAALTAATFGKRGAAFSLDASASPHWDTAQSVAREVIAWLIDADEAVTLNVNVPDVAPEELRGLRQARLSAFGAVQANVTDTGEGFIKLAFTEIDADPEPGTDSAFLADSWACFTPLQAACELSLAVPLGAGAA